MLINTLTVLNLMAAMLSVSLAKDCVLEAA